jgi:hypothetical protein
MTAITKTAAGILASVVLSGAPHALRAEDANPIMTMTPLHGISFDIGTKRAISFYLNNAGQCRLVLTLADALVGDEPPAASTTRYETTVPAADNTRIVLPEGNALEFVCHAEARAMSVKPAAQLAVRGPLQSR